MILPGPLFDLDRDGEITARDLFLLNEILEDSEESEDSDDELGSDLDLDSEEGDDPFGFD